MTGRRITRVLGLLAVLLGLTIAPATGAGAQYGGTDPGAGRESHAATLRRVDGHLVASLARPRVGLGHSAVGRRTDAGGLPLLATLVPGLHAPGPHAGARVAAEPGRRLHASSTAPHCGRGPPAA